jgi:hypothetical protein
MASTVAARYSQPFDLLGFLRSQLPGADDLSECERLERRLAQKYGANECAHKGHAWYAPAHFGIKTVVCIRTDCHLSRHPITGYAWDGEPA